MMRILIYVGVMTCAWIFQVLMTLNLPALPFSLNYTLVAGLFFLCYFRTLFVLSLLILGAYSFDLLMGAQWFYLLRYSLVYGICYAYVMTQEEDHFPLFRLTLAGTLLYELSAMIWYLPFSEVVMTKWLHTLPFLLFYHVLGMGLLQMIFGRFFRPRSEGLISSSMSEKHYGF